MAHGSGSHGRSAGRPNNGDGGGSRNRRGNSASARTTRDTNTPNTPNNSAARRGINQNHPRTTTRDRSSPTIERNNNHGSGTRHHSRNGGRSAASCNSNNNNDNHRTNVRATRRNHNHGSGTHQQQRETRATNTNTTALPVSQTRMPNAAGGTGTTTTTTRNNHGEGHHHNHRQGRREEESRNNNTRTQQHHLHHYHYHSNSQRRRGGAFHNEQDRDYYESREQRRDDGAGGLVCQLCTCFCTCLGAILLGVSAVLGAILCCEPCFRLEHSMMASSNYTAAAGGGARTNGDSPAARRRRRRGCSWLVLPALGLFLSIVLFFVLIRNSTMDTRVSFTNDGVGVDTNNNNVWTLFAGETQRIFLSRFVRNVRVTVVSPTDSSVDAAVFTFPRQCPPLTGPPVVLQHDSAFDLKGDSFEYDYYNLSPGSTVDVRFHPLSGATYFYLLQGAEALRDVQTGRNIDPNHWEHIAVAKRYITTNTGPRNTDVHYKVQGPTNDMYTLVYDNASTQRKSSIDVETDLVLTTYNLAGYTPQCDNMHWRGNSGDTCRVAATRDNCVILEAFSTTTVTDHVDPNSKEEGNGLGVGVGGGDGDGADRVISLRIDAYRNWTSICLWSLVPLAFACLVCIWQFLLIRCCGRLNSTTSTDDDSTLIQETNASEPLLQPNSNDNYDVTDQEEITDLRPPPTAPRQHDDDDDVVASGAEATHRVRPSAPPEDPPVIVIPPEHVEPVPPTGRK